MNKTISIIRIAILLLTSTIAFFGIFSEPLDNSTTWEMDFLISKTIGFGLGYLSYRLYKRWQNDPLISKYEEWCDVSDTELD